MKYKIGELEVKAVQWNDTNCSFNEIYNLAKQCGKDVDIERINIGGYDDFKLKVEVSDSRAFLHEGAYLVKSENSLFTLSEQDFNKIATKVKEPKFKVGDTAYSFIKNSFDDSIIIEKVTIAKINSDDDFMYVDEELFRSLHVSILFTLEEAIEKLKEL